MIAVVPNGAHVCEPAVMFTLLIWLMPLEQAILCRGECNVDANLNVGLPAIFSV